MGNALCRSTDCFNNCFRKPYDRWISTLELNRVGSSASQKTKQKDHAYRNRITEYITWALNRSRSPMLLNDVDSVSQDLNGPNTVSWMSDAASSDASHLLYREVDPYNQASFTQMATCASPGSSKFDASDTPKEGGWFAVTKLSDSKHGTLTSAVFLPEADAYNLTQKPGNLTRTDALSVPLDDEELDGPELARLARSLWPRNTSRKKSNSDASTAKLPPNYVVPPFAPQVSTSAMNPTRKYPPFSESTPINCTKQLNLRTLPSKGIVDQDVVESCTVQIDSPIELDWDHEPGTVSTRTPRKFSSQRQRIVQALHTMDDFPDLDFNTDDELQLNDVSHGFSRTGNVAVLPLTANSPPQLKESSGDFTVPTTRFKGGTNRWTNSEVRMRDSPQTRTTDIVLNSNLLVSPSTHLPDPLLSKHFHAPTSPELLDSGFVGFSGGSCADESDGAGCRMADFLWEHELFFDSPQSPQLTTTSYT